MHVGCAILKSKLHLNKKKTLESLCYFRNLLHHPRKKPLFHFTQYLKDASEPWRIPNLLPLWTHRVNPDSAISKGSGKYTTITM